MQLNWLTDSIREFIHRGDRLLLALCLLTNGFGTALIYSATRRMNYLAGLRCMLIQAVGIVLGVFVYTAMSSADIELLTEKFWKWLFLLGLFINLLLLTSLEIDADETGNNNWPSIPGLSVNLQLVELAKLTFVLLPAWQMNWQRERELSCPSSVFQLAGHTLVMLGLIVVTSGDFGMVLAYVFISVIMAWAGGVKKRWFPLATVVCVMGTVLVWSHISDKYFARRITAVIDHITGSTETTSEQARGQGSQQICNILAIGSRGLFGMGYLKGIRTQSLSEPTLSIRYTDEILAVCGEEFGLIGCAVLLLLLGAIIARCIWVARWACSPQSVFIAMGYAGMLLVQVGINAGMCSYAFPVVGLTLPFISYGGTSIVTVFVVMGIISSIKMHSPSSWLRDRSRI